MLILCQAPYGHAGTARTCSGRPCNLPSSLKPRQLHRRSPRSAKLRAILRFVVCALLAWMPSAFAALTRSGVRPNIVFILIDDMGWTDGGCFGSKYYRTPSLDTLAAAGMRFTQAYAACAVCSPTRAAIDRPSV